MFDSKILCENVEEPKKILEVLPILTTPIIEPIIEVKATQELNKKTKEDTSSIKSLTNSNNSKKNEFKELKKPIAPIRKGLKSSKLFSSSSETEEDLNLLKKPISIPVESQIVTKNEANTIQQELIQKHLLKTEVCKKENEEPLLLEKPIATPVEHQNVTKNEASFNSNEFKQELLQKLLLKETLSKEIFQSEKKKEIIKKVESEEDMSSNNFESTFSDRLSLAINNGPLMPKNVIFKYNNF